MKEISPLRSTTKMLIPTTKKDILDINNYILSSRSKLNPNNKERSHNFSRNAQVLGTNLRKIQAPGYWFLPSFVRTDFPFALMFPIIYYFDLVVKANSIASENLNFAEFRIYPHKIEECNCQGITCTLSGYSPKILGTAILRTYSPFSFNVL